MFVCLCHPIIKDEPHQCVVSNIKYQGHVAKSLENKQDLICTALHAYGRVIIIIEYIIMNHCEASVFLTHMQSVPTANHTGR